jgi:DNA-binding LacI/PurR family transcriptional regulator
MSITIKEIAERANLSIATVSRALNNLESVKPATRDLILSIADELNYKPNMIARNLVKNTSNIIGVVLPQIDGEFFSEIIHGVDEIAYSGGYHTIVASSHSQRTVVQSIVNFMNETLVSGIIILAPMVDEKIREIVSTISIPTVIINGKIDLQTIDSVCIDNYQGAYSMTEYLIKTKGYKKIAHIRGPLINTDSSLRYKGYIAALKDNNIPINENWIINGEFTAESGENGCRRLLSLKKKPEVIFAGNDMMALGCYKAIESFGLKIPTDIGVVGFDNIFLSGFLSPRLTTVHVPISEIGKTAAEMLLKRMKGEGNSEHKHLDISTGLVIGGSC